MVMDVTILMPIFLKKRRKKWYVRYEIRGVCEDVGQDATCKLISLKHIDWKLWGLFSVDIHCLVLFLTFVYCIIERPRWPSSQQEVLENERWIWDKLRTSTILSQVIWYLLFLSEVGYLLDLSWTLDCLSYLQKITTLLRFMDIWSD